MDDRDPTDPNRSPWSEGPDEGMPPESWLGQSDDELLHTIETVSSQRDADERLLEVVASHRHFFIRQEAAKRIRRKKLLFPYEDDRHIGQILVRHLTRREDLTYLERLVARSKHGEVRKAAQVQLSRLRTRLEDQDRRDATRQAQGKAPWRVAVVHPEAAVRAVVVQTLAPPEYDARAHESGTAAEAAVLAFEPHLLLAGPNELLTAGLHAAIRRRGRALPAVALCEPQDAARLPEMVGKGVDEYMLLPVLPELLAAKAQALLHLAHLAQRRAEHRKASGPIGEEGVVPLLKLCEDEQLTCRLVVASEGSRWFADFVAGEMTEAGGSPPLGDDEALAAILAVRSGTYEMIETIPADEEEIDTTPALIAAASVVSSATAAAAPSAAPASEWRVPDVDATLLGWAVHFIVEQAWSRLGTAATAGLLRRTLQDGASRHEILKLFNIEENAHVGIDLSQGARVPTEAVGATAQWMAVFVAAVRRIAPDAGAIDVRQATKIVGAALEHVDFYIAYDRAAAQQHRETKATSHVIGKIDLKRPK